MWDGVASLTRSAQQWCTLRCESLASLVAEVTWQHLCPRLLKLDKQSCSVQACFSSDAMPTRGGVAKARPLRGRCNVSTIRGRRYWLERGPAAKYLGLWPTQEVAVECVAKFMGVLGP